MISLVDKVIRTSKTGIFSFTDVLALETGSRGALRMALTRAVASGDVKRIRRGLYCLSSELSPVLPHPYVLANLVYGPAYVSMETALEYHGWIPEAVHSVFSVTNSRCRRFVTPFGLFKYESIKQWPLMAGVDRIDSDPSGTFFVARPLKALCDIVVARHMDWSGVEPLVESLRIETESLETLSSSDFLQLENVYYSKKAAKFLAGLKKELGL